ncbi:HTH DNA binding protein [Bacillus phage Shbh1]|uniref:DNA binding-like protein n=1 Tax=Bacillus phage Shbh1 TaxID=1796992 RepID=A0A142F1G6_9CAUD|nr:HTH DNA binding protein [Bacillus phage Shbh1]AMQ66623.1 DNA binding-like protein [Bacillus phage Shbh1]
MEYSVYLESSVVELKPRVLKFLNTLIEKAKEVKDHAISLKKCEIADMVGKDTRTVSRYLKELQEQDIIEVKGKKGRSGGTLIMFNTELIRFNSSDKALINTNQETIEEALNRKFPKKPEKEPKRSRRTKQQILEDKLLNQEHTEKLNYLNDKVERLGGVPDWSWFKETEDPIGNYRTYLISRMYNRYAALFTDKHNAEVEVTGQGNPVSQVTNDYDVLPMRFFGTSRWYQFEKIRLFLEKNDIDPAVYLSAQFSRSIFNGALKNQKKKMLPYVNALISDTSYDVYKQYCEYQKKVSYTYASYQMIPSQFSDDFVIRALCEGYYNADFGTGMLELRSSIEDFLYNADVSDEEEALYNFYRLTESNLRKSNVSFSTRDTLKKFLILQSLSISGGVSRLPNYVILGSEMVRAILVSIDQNVKSKEDATYMKSLALGMLTYPNLDRDEQVAKGRKYLYQYNVLHETPQVIKLVMQRKGLYLSVVEINKSLSEYGKEKIPLDDFSVLDVGQIVDFIHDNTPVLANKEEVDLSSVTQKRQWDLVGTKEGEESAIAMIDKELGILD